MTRPATKGFQKPVDSGKRKPVGIAIIHYGEAAGFLTAECSCGAPFFHQRKKALEDKIDVHLLKKHGGQGLRL